MAESPLLSIIIVAYKSREEIGACLGSLPQVVDGHPVEAIVVDLRTHSRPLTGDLPVPVRSNGAAPAGRSAQRSQA